MFRQLILSIAVSCLTSPLACAQNEAVPEPDRATLYPAQAVQADFDQLYAGLREGDYNLFAVTPQAVFDQRFAEMRADFDHPMARFEVQRDFQLFAALARHGHTRLEFPMDAFDAYRVAGGVAFPVSIRVQQHGVFVESDATGLPDIKPGDEILGFNGLPNSIWMQRLTRHISAETPILAHTLLEYYLPGLIWIEWPELTSATLQVRHADGSESDLVIPFIDRETRAARTERSVESFSLDGHDAHMITPQIAYLRPGPFYNDTPGGHAWDTSDFTSFVDAAFEQFLAAGAERLILDLRDNPGGDNSFSDPMIAWFADRDFVFASDFSIRVSPESVASNQARIDAAPAGQAGPSEQLAALYAGTPIGETVSFELPMASPRQGARFDGEVWVLVNRYSFSNAVNVAALVQDYGFGHVAGETTADMSTTYGAMEHFTLDQTGLQVGYPKAHIIRPNGETRSHPVTPDLILDFPAIRGPRDVVLEQLMARLSEDD
ncbi:S41 family peptidase [uncultured Maricaulis sp.]|uniref:S41 family peptidase n=1 Tax=uncultured Maricaulis sp. TaxID=174710 RepID=UPI0030DA7038|tara:strand:- start:24025 stop:25497 length:1473 start_codon:yes stop_codon:yes gene_type:complete